MKESVADRFVILTRTVSRDIRTVTPNSVYIPPSIPPTDEGLVAAAHVLRVELTASKRTSRIYELQHCS